MVQDIRRNCFTEEENQESRISWDVGGDQVRTEPITFFNQILFYACYFMSFIGAVIVGVGGERSTVSRNSSSPKFEHLFWARI